MRLAFMLAAAPALAQFTITLAGPDGETSVDAIATVGTVDPGDTLETRFRLRNPSSLAIRLTALRISGVAFSLDGQPSTPYVIAPGTNVDFTVRFAPTAFGSYSAALQVNERLILVRGEARLAALLLAEGEGGWQPVDPRYPVDFGRVAANRTVVRRFLLFNEAALPVRVSRVEVSGPNFHLDGDLSLPVDLPPRGEIGFRIRFEPARAGVFRGQLRVDTRVAALDGAAFDPPLPAAVVELPSDAAESGKQITGVVRFAEQVEAAGRVRLTLRFQPAADGTPDDMSVQFLPSASRSIELSAAPGDTRIPFVFQTGATAGLLSLWLESGPVPREARLVIPPAPVRIHVIEAERAPGAILVRLDGVDNTRSASLAVFRFTERNGREHSPIRVDVGSALSGHFRESPLGGLFSMRLRFPVTGDAREVTGVAAEIHNAQGAGHAGPIRF